MGTAAIDSLVTVTDPLPAGLAPVSATGTGWACGVAGQAVTCTVTPAGGLTAGTSLPAITVTVDVTGAAAPGVTNTATVANASDTNPANDTSSSPTAVTSADLAVAKTVNGASSASAPVGATVTYAVTVSNLGPDTASGVSVAEALPAGLTLVTASASQGAWDGATWSVGTLADGATASLTVSATVDAGQGGNEIDNTATVSGGPYDLDPANDSAAAALTVLPPSADLAVTKTDGTTAVDAGAVTTYTVRVTNNGPDGVTGAVLADPVVSGLGVTAVACSVTPGQCSAPPSVA